APPGAGPGPRMPPSIDRLPPGVPQSWRPVQLGSRPGPGDTGPQGRAIRLRSVVWVGSERRCLRRRWRSSGPRFELSALPPTLPHVGDVFFLGSESKVLHPDTGRVIADVANHLTGLRFTVSDNPSEPVGG